MTVWYELKTLDGRTLSLTHGLGESKWQWVLDNVTGDAECSEQDVDVDDAEDGEFVTVHGKRYARVIISF